MRNTFTRREIAGECKDVNNPKNVAATCMQADLHVFIEVSAHRLVQCGCAPRCDAFGPKFRKASPQERQQARLNRISNH